MNKLSALQFGARLKGMGHMGNEEGHRCSSGPEGWWANWKRDTEKGEEALWQIKNIKYHAKTARNDMLTLPQRPTVFSLCKTSSLTQPQTQYLKFQFTGGAFREAAWKGLSLKSCATLTSHISKRLKEKSLSTCVNNNTALMGARRKST